MTWSISRNELTDPSFVTLRHSSRHLDIWLISGWHWAHLSHHGNSVRPCFGALPRPGLCWAGHFTFFFFRRPVREWACLLSCCLSYFHQDSSPMLPCLTPAGLSTSYCLALSPPFPLPPFSACRPDQHIGSILQISQRASEPARAPMQEQGGQPDRLVLPSTAYHSLVRSRPSHDQRLSRRPRQLWTF